MTLFEIVILYFLTIWVK